MTIQLPGYRVSRTQQLEDLTTGLGTSLSATAAQIWTENPASSAFRASALEREVYGDFVPGTKGARVKGPKTPILSKDDADRRVKDAGVPISVGDQGIPEGALDILIKRKREELKRKALIDAAPGGFWSGAAQIGTGLAVSLADPINIASAFVPVVGQARYAKLLAGATTPAGRAAVRTGVGITEGAVGAALVEPVVLLAARSEQAEYGMYDSFLNLTFGAVLGGGLHVSLGAVSDALARSAGKTKESLLRSAVGQAMDERPIDVGYVAKTDPSFRSEWRDTQIDRAIKGLQVDAKVQKAFNQAMDELRPELISRAAALESADSAIADIEAGRVPEVFADDVATVVKQNIEDFDAPPPDVNAWSREASPTSSRQAQETLDRAVEETPESIDRLTDDVFTALEEKGVDTAEVRAEVDEINQVADREARGMRAAMACLLGR